MELAISLFYYPYCISLYYTMFRMQYAGITLKVVKNRGHFYCGLTEVSAILHLSAYQYGGSPARPNYLNKLFKCKIATEALRGIDFF
jgi:hypothetical protein